MTRTRDARLWLLAGAAVVALLGARVVHLHERDRELARVFDESQTELTWMAAALQLEHHRLETAARRFAEAGDRRSRDRLLERHAIYLSRYEALESHAARYLASLDEGTATIPLPRPRTERLATVLRTLQVEAPAVLDALEPAILVLRPGQAQTVRTLQSLLDELGDDIDEYVLAAFERSRYLNRTRRLAADALAERLDEAVRLALAAGGLLTLALLVHLGHKRRSAATLRLANARLAAEVEASTRLSRELERRADRDGVSGLLNRHGFARRFDALLARGEGHHGLCFVDLDHFKVVNDSFGHACGDRVIGEIASVLQAQTRDGDLLSRHGGDEFVVLLHDCDRRVFEQRAQELCTALLDHSVVHDGRRLDVSGSFGAIHFAAEAAEREPLLAIADAAAYVAKRAGGARVHIHDDGNDPLEARSDELVWIERIRTALREDGFALYRQPILALDGGGDALHGWEFLLRMLDADGTVLSPSRFLDVAERYSLATPIDRWVVRRVFDWCAANGDVFERIERVNVNLSGRSVGDAEFLAFLESLTPTLAVATSRICFELTESSLVDERAGPFLQRLGALGYGIALDDFGSGFSSFSYLETLPVDCIKIDGHFVRDVDRSAAHREFVRAIDAVGKAMGKTVVAEFVASAEAIEVLREIGVDYAQGYHVGAPEPVPDRDDGSGHERRSPREVRSPESVSLPDVPITRSGTG